MIPEAQPMPALDRPADAWMRTRPDQTSGPLAAPLRAERRNGSWTAGFLRRFDYDAAAVTAAIVPWLDALTAAFHPLPLAEVEMWSILVPPPPRRAGGAPEEEIRRLVQDVAPLFARDVFHALARGHDTPPVEASLVLHLRRREEAENAAWAYVDLGLQHGPRLTLPDDFQPALKAFSAAAARWLEGLDEFVVIARHPLDSAHARARFHQIFDPFVPERRS